MSQAARTALINIGTQRQGATAAARTAPAVIDELQRLGYIGKGHGLTRKGSIKRQILLEDTLNDLFG